MPEKILTPTEGFGWLRGDAPDLDRKLRAGDGLAWAGDPDLDLRQGVVEEVRSGRPTGNIVARRWEVWRHCEDGLDRMVGHWRMEEFDRILFDLTRMRVDSPGHVDSVDHIEAHNVANEERLWAPGHEALANAHEHLAKLWFDRNHPKQKFRGIPGLNPEKQA